MIGPAGVMWKERSGSEKAWRGFQTGLQTLRGGAFAREAPLLHLQLDVSNPDEWNEIVRHTVQTYNRLDILVNNAGIAQRGGAVNQPVT